MPFAKRDPSGRITALLAQPESGAEERVEVTHPDVVAFLGGNAATGAPLGRLADMDAHMARVMEDLIDVLVSRGVLMFTDLPPPAQHKLLERRRLRQDAATPGTPPAAENDDLI